MHLYAGSIDMASSYIALQWYTNKYVCDKDVMYISDTIKFLVLWYT